MDFAKLWIILVPLLFGSTAAYLFIRWRASKRKISFLSGLGSWLLFLVSSVIGEIVARVLNQTAYREIGDNPMQMVGLAISWLLSIFLCAFIWLIFKRDEKRQGKA